jgi:hypothetical protein
MAVYMFDVAEIAIVGHAACRMAAFDASSFIASFRKRGVAREAFGPEDLRVWSGAIPSPQRGVMLSAANIRAAAFFPADLRIAGAVLDEATGALEIVPLGEAAPRTTVSEEPAAPAAAHEEQARQAPEAAAPAALIDTLEGAVDSFADVVRSAGRLRDELPRLRQELDRAPHAVAKLRGLEAFARRAGDESAEVRTAFARLRHEIFGQPEELPQVLHLLSRKL